MSGFTAVPSCGDYYVVGTEVCDDGSGIGCGASCATITDGYVCYFGTNNRQYCEWACGNSKVETGEDCDDGNVINGDGCSKWCTAEQGYTCAGGSSSGKDTCTPTCGDGYVAGNEVCDDGN